MCYIWSTTGEVIPRKPRFFLPKIRAILCRSHVKQRFISSNLPCSMRLYKSSPKSILCAISRPPQVKLFQENLVFPRFKPEIRTILSRSHVKQRFIGSNLSCSMRLYKISPKSTLCAISRPLQGKLFQENHVFPRF